MKFYKLISISLASIFAAVGLLFLLAPAAVLAFFNLLSPSFGLSESNLTGLNFYSVLAVGYMYIVTLLAYGMYHHPQNGLFPLLLAHAKLASSILSAGLFLLHAKYLIYAANFVIDGAIGGLALFFYLKIRSEQKWV